MSPERAADRKGPAMFRAAAAIVLSVLKLGMTDLLTVVSLNGCGNCKLTDRVLSPTACLHSQRRLGSLGVHLVWWVQSRRAHRSCCARSPAASSSISKILAPDGARVRFPVPNQSDRPRRVDWKRAAVR